jgi:hypothetical protein
MAEFSADRHRQVLSFIALIARDCLTPKGRKGERSDTRKRGGTPMQYKVKNLGALQIALGGLPNGMHVEADREIGISAKTVGELRKVKAWPENLVITTPQGRSSERAIRVSKTTHATRVTPKS